MRRDITAGKVIARVLKILIYISLIVYCISLMVPIIWMIFTSFKGNIEYSQNIFLWPKKWTLENFPSAYNKFKISVLSNNTILSYDFFDMFSISVIWATGVAFLHVLLTTIVAYALSRYKFFGSEFLYLLGIFIMITPIIGSAPSMMVVRRSLGIYNNLLLMMLTTHSATFSGLHFMIMYAAFKGIPSSYSEAAQIDGAGHYDIMLKIMIPMMLPTCAVIFVLSFLTHWNEYGTFLIWLPGYPNLSYGIYLFQHDSVSYGAKITEIMAGFLVAIIPSMTLYLLSQKLINAKFTVGGLKG